MKKSLLLLYALFCAGVTHAQLRIRQQPKLVGTSQAVKDFLEKSRFDYALLAWEDAWASQGNTFSGIIQQKKKWYVVQLHSRSAYDSDTSFTAAGGIELKQLKITALQADSLLSLVNPAAAFGIARSALDSLNEGCLIRNAVGELVHSQMLEDLGYLYLAESRKNSATVLSKYAVGYLLRLCTPVNPGYARLRGLLTAHTQLLELKKNFPAIPDH